MDMEPIVEEMQRREQARKKRKFLGLMYYIAIGLAVVVWWVTFTTSHILVAIFIGFIILVVLFYIHKWLRKQYPPLPGQPNPQDNK